LAASGAWERQRRDQRVAWLWSELREGLMALFLEDRRTGQELSRIETAVAKGETLPVAEARAILARWQAKT